MKKSFLLRGANDMMINLPHKVWRDLGWKVNEKMELIPKKMYNKDKNTAYTITIRKVEDWESE